MTQALNIVALERVLQDAWVRRDTALNYFGTMTAEGYLRRSPKGLGQASTPNKAGEVQVRTIKKGLTTYYNLWDLTKHCNII